MKLLGLILSLTICSSVIGQTFKKYKDTQFYNTSIVSDGKIPYAKIKFEYIKKGDTILVLHKDLLKKFLVVFENNPASFDTIYSYLMDERNKNNSHDKYDTILFKTKYKVYKVINEVTIIHGDKELIWQATNHDFILGSNPCYINIIFNYKKPNSDDPDNLKFIKAQLEYCEI